MDVYMEFLAVLIIVGLFAVIGRIVNRVIKALAPKLFGKTNTKLDDLLVEAIRRPIFVGFVLTGTYLSLPGLSFLDAFGYGVATIYSLVFILYIGWAAVRVINAVIEWYMLEIAIKTKSKKDEQFVPIVRKVMYGVVFLVAFFWILGQLGVEPTALVAALGVGGLAIALGLQDTLKELFAGAFLIADRPIRIGDLVELDSGDRGTVVDIGMRTTKIRNYQNNLIILPNSTVANSRILNYETPDQKFLFYVENGVGYGEDLDKVEKVTLQVAKKVVKKMGTGADGFEPYMRFGSFGDSNIMYKVFFKTNKFGDKFPLMHEFIKELKKEYDKQKIEISWPVRKVYNYNTKKW
jgi:small-conductance mechanosensitive channel